MYCILRWHIRIKSYIVFFLDSPKLHKCMVKKKQWICIHISHFLCKLLLKFDSLANLMIFPFGFYHIILTFINHNVTSWISPSTHKIDCFVNFLLISFPIFSIRFMRFKLIKNLINLSKFIMSSLKSNCKRSRKTHEVIAINMISRNSWNTPNFTKLNSIMSSWITKRVQYFVKFW